MKKIIACMPCGVCFEMISCQGGLLVLKQAYGQNGPFKTKGIFFASQLFFRGTACQFPLFFLRSLCC
jgi:hypothetical protein